MATPVDQLDLPVLDFLGLDRATSLLRMREIQTSTWIAKGDLGFVVVSYEDAVAILRDRRFHSAISMVTRLADDLPPVVGSRQESILAMEGDPHQRLRRLVAPAFTPSAAELRRPFMREVITSLVDAVGTGGTCEFVEAVCEPYPIPIICELLGAPKDDWKLFSRWATDIFRIFNGMLAEDIPLIEAAANELEAYVAAMIAERRLDPRDDLLSSMIAIEEAGDRLSTSELVMMAEAVLMAGTDTTRNQLACTMALFAQHPEQWKILREHPELASRAVEESMRVLGAVRATARFASEPIEYRDVLFPQGTFVAVSLATANHDPKSFDDPGEFDITVERGTVQMTFGSGIHYCLGAALARAELQEALLILSQRWETLELNGPIEWKPDQNGIWGPAVLPLRFT